MNISHQRVSIAAFLQLEENVRFAGFRPMGAEVSLIVGPLTY